LLVAVLGTPAPADVVDAFKDCWWMMVGAAFGAAVAFAMVGRLAPRQESLEQEVEEGIASMAPEVVA
jgi:hypothetical protein